MLKFKRLACGSEDVAQYNTKKCNTGKPEYVGSPVSTGGLLGAKPLQTKLQAPQIEK